VQVVGSLVGDPYADFSQRCVPARRSSREVSIFTFIFIFTLYVALCLSVSLCLLVARSATVTAALATIGVTPPTVALGTSWSFIGRKGSSLSTNSFAREFVRGGVKVQSLFRCYRQALMLPENAVPGQELSLVYPSTLTTTGEFAASPALSDPLLFGSTLMRLSTMLNAEATSQYTVGVTIAQRGFDRLDTCLVSGSCLGAVVATCSVCEGMCAHNRAAICRRCGAFSVQRLVADAVAAEHQQLPQRDPQPRLPSGAPMRHCTTRAA
jgi:hypothetical protein